MNGNANAATLVMQVQGTDGQRSNVRVPASRCLIGKDPDSGVQLAGWRISRQHAELFLSNDGVFLRDLESTFGTFVNGKRISTYGPLSPQDEIKLGGYVLQLQVAPKGVSAATPLAASPLAVPPARGAQSSQGAGSVAPGAPTVMKPAAPAVPPAPVVARAAPLPQPEPQPATTPMNTPPARSPLDDEMFRLRRLLHEKLVEAFDVRRVDVHRMGDEELRKRTEELIAELMERTPGIPKTIDRALLVEAVRDEAIGLGLLEPLLADASVTEIMVNRADEVFVERDGRLQRHPVAFTSDRAVLGIIERIVAPIGRRIDEASPMVDARLKDGSRVNAVIAPLALKGPSITIRKFSKRKLVSDDLLKFGSASAQMIEFLKIAVEHKKNVIISGGTGSGKTTLLNIMSNFIPEGERIVTIEDAAELQLHHPNLVGLEARPANIEGKGQIAIRDLVKNALRMRPDRIVVGECRGGEALDMLQAMNTGHDGSLTTAHANSPRDMLARLEVMVLMAGMDLPVTAIREQVASAVDIVVQQTRFACGTRKITHICEVTGVESGRIQLQDIFMFKQTGVDERGKTRGFFTGCGFVPEFYEDLRRIGVKVDLDIFTRNDAEGKAA